MKIRKMCQRCWKFISLTTGDYIRNKKGYFCLGCSKNENIKNIKNIRGVIGDKKMFNV